MELQKKLKKIMLPALKIAIGSSAAIWIAESLSLQYASSAGIIALLTIASTKWETMRLSLYRLITFCITVILTFLLFHLLPWDWATYGLFLLFTVIYSTWIGWRVTISVNAVIATHFLTVGNFSLDFVLNEFLLVLIGISIAILINLFYNYKGQLREVLRGMRFTETQLQNVLREVSAYLSETESYPGVWQDIGALESQIQEFIHEAYEYSGNLFPTHSHYYVDYLEMRLSQCRILQSLHAQMRKIRTMPEQAHLISEYILYLTEYIVEMNIPQKQLDRLHQISQDMEQEPMPQTREEFEGRAILYHILMDLEEFLHAKQRFVETMDPAVKKIYWGN